MLYNNGVLADPIPSVVSRFAETLLHIDIHPNDQMDHVCGRIPFVMIFVLGDCSIQVELAHHVRFIIFEL